MNIKAIGKRLERYPFLHSVALAGYHRWSVLQNTLRSTRAMRGRPRKGRPRVLFYQLSGMSFGGTEKNLQILAKHLSPDKYDVFFMYSSKPQNTITF